MKRIAFIILLALGSLASAQSLYQGVYSPLPSNPNGPDAEYQLIRRHYTASDTDSYLNVRKEITILRNRALTAYADKGESFILWNPSTQELTINECYTIQRDGKRVEMNPMGFVEQLPSECTDCGPYNAIREMAIVHCGMEYGCTIVLDYTIHTLHHNIVEDHLIINQDCPVKRYELMVDVPQGQQERLECYSSKEGYTSGTHSISLAWNNVSPTYQDAYLPDADDLYESVWFSNAREGEHLVTEFDSVADAQLLLDTYLDDNNLRYATKLRDYVVDHIAYKPLHPAMLDYRYMLPNDTWHHNCGTSIDKAVLLAALLQQAGFQPVVQPGFRTAHNVTVADPSLTVVRLTIDSVEYALSPLHKGTLTPYGAAVDEVDTIIVSRAITEPTLQPYAGRYCRIALPDEKGLSLNPSLLTPSRTAPLKVRPVVEQYSYTITLPDGIVLAAKPVHISKSRKGLGQMEISISQEGNTLHVSRQLLLPNTYTISNPKDYKAFREWMILWNQYKEIIVK